MKKKKSQNIRKRKGGRKCNSKVKSSGKIKRQRERGNVERSITVNVD